MGWNLLTSNQDETTRDYGLSTIVIDIRISDSDKDFEDVGEFESSFRDLDQVVMESQKTVFFSEYWSISWRYAPEFTSVAYVCMGRTGSIPVSGTSAFTNT